MEYRDQILVTFGNILRKYRQDAGLSQEKLALECGLDRTFISLLERGKRQPSIITLLTVAEQLNTKPSVLVAELESSL